MIDLGEQRLALALFDICTPIFEALYFKKVRPIFVGFLHKFGKGPSLYYVRVF